MRIVYLLLHDFRFASIGLQEFAYDRFHFSKEYARRLARLGHEVKLYVLADGPPRRRTIELDGFELKVFKTSFRFPPFMRFGNDHCLGVLNEIERDDPDLIHFHNYYLWNFSYTAPWARRGGVPLVAQYHGTDPIHALKGLAFLPSLRLCNRLLVPTKSEKQFLLKNLGIPPERVELLPSPGVDTQTFKPTKEKPDSPLLLYAGRVPRPASYRWEKAPGLLLPMLKHLIDGESRAKLIVAGDGPGLPTLIADAKRLGILQHVTFLGHVSQERLAELYSSAWLTFVPLYMEDIEPFRDGAIQESLACGTPVAAINGRSKGFRRFGLLFPPDAEGASELVSEALADSRRMSNIGKDGQQFVRTNCDWEVIADRMNGLYSSLHG
jgi:glycosyltransferase involved in cell wall biosynthesis